MANQNKNKRIYDRIIGVFDSVARGDIPEDLESTTSKAYILFLNGYDSSQNPESDYANKTLGEIKEYCKLLSRRKKIDMEGGEREITTEDEALLALFYATSVLKTLVIPLFREKTDFSNRVFNDIYNLSLAYIDAIVDGVAEEYIGDEDALEAKLGAVGLAKQGLRVCEIYQKEGLSDNLRVRLKRFEEALDSTNNDFMRSFQTVATTRKSIYTGKKLMEKVKDEVTEQDVSGKLMFRPSVVFPIAHGGSELGIVVSNGYEDIGHNPVVYPLMFSMKTRKHRHPWVENDNEFLKKSLEGQDVLITEDWVTTGNTVRGIINKIENSYPHEVRIATLKRDKDKSNVPFLDNYQFYTGRWSKYLGKKTDALADMK